MKTHRIIVALCSITLFSGNFLQAQLTLQDSLVLSLQFSGNTVDSSGNQNDAVGVGSVLTTDRFGNPNSAIFLDGVNDYVLITDNQDLKPQLPITISAWVKIEDNDPNLVIWNDWEENVYNGVWMNIVAGRVSIAFGDGNAIGPQSRRSKKGTSTIPLQTWTHVTGIIRGAGDMDIYIDGRNDCGTYNGSGGSIGYSNSPGRMGQIDPFASAGTVFDFFHGSIDDVRLYNRELSEEEISSLAGVDPLQNLADSICTGESVILSAPTGFAGYSWSPSGSLSCVNCANPLASPTLSTTYQLTLTKTPGCTEMISYTVTVTECCDGSLGSLIEGVSEPRCPEDSLGSFFIQGANGTPPYQYSLDSISFSSSGQFNNLTPGTYKIWIRDSLDCEFDTTVTLNTPPGVISSQISFTGETAFGTNDGTAKVIPSGGNGGPWSYLWSNGAGTDSVSGLAPGQYTVNISDTKGCFIVDTVIIPAAALSISGFPLGNTWNISPNPASRLVEVSWELPAFAEAQLVLTDLHGRTLQTIQTTRRSGATIFSLDYPAGVYLIRIRAGEYQESRKLVIQ